MATRIKLRRDTAANWLESNPILAQGETGFETDTRMMKLGDGATRWADLKYAVTGNLKVTDNTIHGDEVVSISSGMGDRSNWILTATPYYDGPNSANAYATAVAYDSMGNAFMTTVYGAPSGGPDSFSGMGLIKVDPNGQVLWNNYYDEYYAFGYSMIVDKNDDVLFVLAEYDPASADTVLVKVSGETGTVVWQKYLADTDNASDDVALCLDIDPSNNVIIAGTTATGGAVDFWVGKFNGSTGASMWQRQYDSDGCTDKATGIAVDSMGNIGVSGSSYGPGTFLGVFKIDGTQGDVMWQTRITNMQVQANEEEWGTAWSNGDLYSSDICVDSDDNFYFSLTGIYCTPWTVAGIHKVNGDTGAWSWSKVISYSFFFSGSSSLICDKENNVYLTSTLQDYRQQNQSNDTSQFATVITKFNATGRKLWSKSLSHEQAAAYAGAGSGYNGELTGVGQTVAVNDDYILVGGGYFETWAYEGGNQNWYNHPYLAQLDKSGTDFVQDGWIFKDNTFKIFEMAASTDTAGYIADLTANTADIVVTTGEVDRWVNFDTTDLTYINKSRVKTMTLDSDRLHLPENGGLALSRKHIGHYTSIGKFDLDGHEGNNVGGNTWINSVTADDKGNVYAVGGWYIRGNDWNDSDNYVEVPLVWKLDSEGALVWQAGNNLNQFYGDMMDAAYRASDNTVLALGHDNELDGHEGFNVTTLDADSGQMKDIIHVRPTGDTPGGNNEDITPTHIKLLSDGTPVVTGAISTTYTEYADVTGGAAGLTGSTSGGVLVINKSVFVREGFDTEYPDTGGNWYIDGSAITHVNSYEDTASVNTTTPGTGAKFDVVTTDGAPGTAAVTVNLGNNGSGYKVGNYFVVLGADIGGVTPTNNLLFQVATINQSGGVLTVIPVAWDTSGYSAWGTFSDVAKELQVGHNATFTVIANPTTRAYTATVSAVGTAYSAGDTVKVLGSLLGGVDGVNDAVITITSAPNGEINTITVTGLGQATTIKLDNGTGNYLVADTYNIWHYTNGDAFIWTPDWHIGFGGDTGYDSIKATAIDTDDNIIVGGYSENLGLPSNTTDWNNGPSQTAYIAKFSNTGEKLWAKAVDGHEGDSTVWGAVTDADNNIYAVFKNQYRPHVIKLDSDGHFMWMVKLDNYTYTSGTFGIAIDANDNIIIAGESRSDDTSVNRVGYSDQVQLAKFDKDGNSLWKRQIWSNNGMQTSYNDYYGNNITVAGDKMIWGGVSQEWNDNDDRIAVVAQLPVDGTGLGRNGNYTYEEIELGVDRWTFNGAFGNGILIVNDVTARLGVRTHTMVNGTYGTDQTTGDNYFSGASGPMTLYANLDGKVAHVLEEGGADITGVKEIVFEDGTRQSTSAQDIPQVDISITNRGDDDYFLRLEDRGHHIYMQDYQGVNICIPNAQKVPFPVGTTIVIVTGNSGRDVYSENNDDYMRLAGADGDANYSWSIPRWSMATLMKIKQGYNNDGTPNNYSEWMIAGPGIN